MDMCIYECVGSAYVWLCGEGGKVVRKILNLTLKEGTCLIVFVLITLTLRKKLENTNSDFGPNLCVIENIQTWDICDKLKIWEMFKTIWTTL